MSSTLPLRMPIRVSSSRWTLSARRCISGQATPWRAQTGSWVNYCYKFINNNLQKNRWNTCALCLFKKQRWKEQLHFHKKHFKDKAIWTCLWSTENYKQEQHLIIRLIRKDVNTMYLSMSTQMWMNPWASCQNVSCRLQLFKMQSTEHYCPIIFKNDHTHLEHLTWHWHGLLFYVHWRFKAYIFLAKTLSRN